MTRRDLVLATPTALLAAQAPQQQAQPQTAEEELNAAREQAKRSGDALAKVNVPMATEPACHFKV